MKTGEQFSSWKKEAADKVSSQRDEKQQKERERESERDPK